MTKGCINCIIRIIFNILSIISFKIIHCKKLCTVFRYLCIVIQSTYYVNQKDLKIHLNYVTQIKKVYLPNQKRCIYRIKKGTFIKSKKGHLLNQENCIYRI